MREIFCDGASRGNPGKAAWAFAIPQPDTLLCICNCGNLGITTNNEAEYWSVIHALNYASVMDFKEVKIISDSQLVIRQLNGEYATNEPRMKLLHDKVNSTIAANGSLNVVQFEWRERTDPILKHADKLCNIVLDVVLK